MQSTCETFKSFISNYKKTLIKWSWVTNFAYFMIWSGICHFTLLIFSNLVDKDGDQSAFNIFHRCEMKCRKVTTYFYNYGCFHMSSFITPVALAIFDICNGNKDTSGWTLQFNMILPVDKQSVVGWFFNWFFQTVSCLAYITSVVLTTSHFACFCYYIIAACDHFDLLMASLRFDDEPHQSSQGRLKMGRKAKEKLRRAIEVHMQIYE